MSCELRAEPLSQKPPPLFLPRFSTTIFPRRTLEIPEMLSAHLRDAQVRLQLGQKPKATHLANGRRTEKYLIYAKQRL